MLVYKEGCLNILKIQIAINLLIEQNIGANEKKLANIFSTELLTKQQFFVVVVYFIIKTIHFCK